MNAPASRTFEHCREWVRQGAEVTVITCAPNFPQGKVYAGYKNRLYQKETMDGIKVVRVWSYMVPNKGFLRRTLDYISFSVTSFIAGLFQDCDVIIATSPQFFTALSGRTLAFWKRKPWIMEVRDLWPASIKTVGAAKSSAAMRYLEWEEKRCYKSAAKIVVVTDSFKKELTARGIRAGKIEVVKNGVDPDLFRPMPKDGSLVKELGLQGKTVIGYIGTHGMAHRLSFIVRCAKALEGEARYHFLLVGDGAEKQNLVALKEKLGCQNLTMLPPVPRQEVRRYLSVLDICLINLKKSPLFTTVIPSKIFENAAMGLPILMGVEGEAQSIVEGYGAGVCFKPEDETDFQEKLHRLGDPEVYKSCQEGCLRLAAAFDRKTLARRMLDVTEKVAWRSGAAPPRHSATQGIGNKE